MEPLQRAHAVLVESTVDFRSTHAVFGRFEIVGKPAHDLHVHESTDVFTVGKLQLGYARYLPPRCGLQSGIGAIVSGSIVPPALSPRYGRRVTPGFGVFFTIRAASAPAP